VSRHAFVMGSNGSAALGELKYAQADADRVADVLAGPRFQFEVSRPSSPGDPYLIKRDLDKLARSCQENDTFIVYFSGHGELMAGELMLVLNDTVPDDETTYLPASWVIEARSRCRARNRLIILDCCHAGAAVGARAGAVDISELGLESKTEIMILASRRLEIAREFEHLRGSFLTHELCAFLASAPTETVVLSALMQRLQVAAHAHNQNPPTGIPRVPIPYLNGDQQGEFVFSVATYPDLSPYVTIRDGGIEAAPASLAVVMAMETALAAHGHHAQLSPRYIREKALRVGEQGHRHGEFLGPVIFVAEHFGVAPEELWPYAPNKTTRRRGITWSKLDDAARRYHTRAIRLDSIGQIHQQLEHRRPVVVGILVHQDGGWYDPSGRGRIVARDHGALIGLHAVVIVSHDRNGYRFANHWTAAWGDNGFGTMDDATADLIVVPENMYAIDMSRWRQAPDAERAMDSE
jgi:hypothetical protein